MREASRLREATRSRIEISAFDFTSLAGQSGTADYTHDDTDQLTDANYNFQSDEDYDYDENGNRVNNGYTVGSNNRLTADGTYAYLYDAEGNRTHRFVDTDTSGVISSGDSDVTGKFRGHVPNLAV